MPRKNPRPQARKRNAILRAKVQHMQRVARLSEGYQRQKSIGRNPRFLALMVAKALGHR